MSSSPEAATVDAADAAARAAFDFAQLAPPAPSERPPSVHEASSLAAAILARAEADAARVREEARSSGFAEGFATGQAEARAQLEPAAAALGDALAGVRDLRERSADAVERHAVDLAIQIAEKVLAGTLAIEPDRVLDVVRGSLHAIIEREQVVVQVNPDDLELVRATATDLAASLGGMEHLEIQQERRVPRGGALVRTSLGEVDARISTKLEKARAVVEAELGA